MHNLEDSLIRAVRERRLADDRGDETTAELLSQAISQIQAALIRAAELAGEPDIGPAPPITGIDQAGRR